MVERLAPQTRTRFSAHPRYRLFALLCAGLAVLFGWELSRNFDFGYLFFLFICLVLAIVNLLHSASYVALNVAGITLHRPFRPTECIEYRQLSAISEEGRLSRNLLIHYHPLAEPPLVDLDSVVGLALPVVVDQDALRETLERQVPA
jgi:hypothetical protein